MKTKTKPKRGLQKPKDLLKRKRLEANEVRVREAVRELCKAARVTYPGDSVEIHRILEDIVTPQVVHLAARPK